MFSNRLKLLRSSKGLTQSQLAEILGLSNKSISVYEKGTSMPNMDVLCKIADYFGVSIDYLIGRSNSVNTKLESISALNHSAILKIQYLSTMVYKQTGISLADILSALIEAPKFDKILRTIYMYCCFSDEDWGIFKSGFINNELSSDEKNSFDFSKTLTIDFMKSVKLKFITDTIVEVIEDIDENHSIIPSYATSNSKPDNTDK